MKNNHKTIKSKCKSENDREARLAQVLTGSECPEEALLKRCAHFDLEGTAKSAAEACDTIVALRRGQLEQCTAEIIKQVGFARDAIARFETEFPPIKDERHKEYEIRRSPGSNFALWQDKEVHDCGDLEANKILPPLVAQGLAAKPDKKVKISEKEKCARHPLREILCSPCHPSTSSLDHPRARPHTNHAWPVSLPSPQCFIAVVASPPALADALPAACARAVPQESQGQDGVDTRPGASFASVAKGDDGPRPLPPLLRERPPAPARRQRLHRRLGQCPCTQRRPTTQPRAALVLWPRRRARASLPQRVRSSLP